MCCWLPSQIIISCNYSMYSAALTKGLNMHFYKLTADRKLITFSSCFYSLQKFDKEPHYALLKELFTQVSTQDGLNVRDVRCVLYVWKLSRLYIWVFKFKKNNHCAWLVQTFATPRYHPKSQPFVDHVFTFTIAENRIWFRNYQVTSQCSWQHLEC